MRRTALFVGIDKYSDQQIASLECAESDAADLYAYFKLRAGYDYVKHFPHPDSDKLLDTAQEMVADLEPGDLFLFFFAGHGLSKERDHLLLFPDVRHSRIGYQQTIPLSLLLRETDKAGIHRILIFDTCRSALERGYRGDSNVGMRNVQAIKETVRSFGSERGSLGILYSCNENEQSREIRQCNHGIFTLALMKLIEQKEANDQPLDFSDSLIDGIEANISAIAKNFEIEVEQRPWIETNGNVPPIIDIGIGKKEGGTLIEPLLGGHLERDESFDAREKRTGTEKALGSSEEMRLSILRKRIHRYRGYLRKLVYRFELGTSLEYGITGTRTASTSILENLHLIVKSPYWYGCLYFHWDAEKFGLARLNCSEAIEILTGGLMEQFSIAEGLSEIKAGRKEDITTGRTESKAAFQLRSAYLNEYLFRDHNKAQRDMEASISSTPDDFWALLKAAEATRLILYDIKRAKELLSRANRIAKTATQYSYLAFTNQAVTDNLEISNNFLHEAERRATDCYGFGYCIKGLLSINTNTEGAERLVEKIEAHSAPALYYYEAPDVVEHLLDMDQIALARRCLLHFDESHFSDSHSVVDMRGQISYALLWRLAFGDGAMAMKALERANRILRNCPYSLNDDLIELGKAHYLIGDSEGGEGIFNEARRKISGGKVDEDDITKFLKDLPELR